MTEHRSINGVAESFFSSVKKERVKTPIYQNRALARTDLANYIEGVYNLTRRCSHLGGVSPPQFETDHKRRKDLH